MYCIISMKDWTLFCIHWAIGPYRTKMGGSDSWIGVKAGVHSFFDQLESELESTFFRQVESEPESESELLPGVGVGAGVKASWVSPWLHVQKGLKSNYLTTSYWSRSQGSWSQSRNGSQLIFGNRSRSRNRSQNIVLESESESEPPIFVNRTLSY